jgi:hypothetical protein
VGECLLSDFAAFAPFFGGDATLSAAGATATTAGSDILLIFTV